MFLVSLVNDDLFDLVPVINEFKNRVKKHILIYDDKDFVHAKRLSKWIKRFCDDVEMIKIDEDSQKDFSKLKEKLSLYKDKLYLNGANIDTAMLVVISSYVLYIGGKVISYDKFENSYNLIDKDGFENYTVLKNLSLEEFITSVDDKILEFSDVSVILKQKDMINTLFKNIKKIFTIQSNFTKLKSLNGYSEELDILKRLNVIDKNLKPIKDSSYLGILFEWYVFLQLLKFDFDDIKSGVKIEFDRDGEKVFVENEFDILAIKDNHIYTIECKIGKNISPQNILYKSDSLLGYFGEDSKNMIVHIHKNPSENFFSKRNILRAKTNNISIFSSATFDRDKFQKKITNFFGVKKRVFLLGGKDLEMLTIKKLLDRYNQDYIDLELSWGAKLSSYEKYFDNSSLFVGIELIKDINTPKFYKEIDHHNQVQNKPSSLEQVAKLLGVELSRYERLVALNDKGYIPAMEEFGATKEEIELIRKEDRKTQGVTKDDEVLAEFSIEDGSMQGKIFVVKALTRHFSPIVDRLYKKRENILIYHDSNKLTYYGRGIKELVKTYQLEVLADKMYYGGNFGFFGIAEGKYKKDEFQKIKSEMINLINNTF